MNILLDYFFPITQIEPTPAASTAFLKQVCFVGLPKDGGVTAGVITACTTNTQIAALLNSGAAAEAAQLLAGGLAKVYVLPMDDLDLADALEGHESDFYTVLISANDFDKDDVNASFASGNITITSYANLLTTTPDSVGVAGVTFTAQSGAVTLGDATFRAATGNTETAASLAAQINGHAVASLSVHAVAALGVVTITALDSGSNGNAIALAYTDNGSGNIGATKSGTVLSGGDGLFLGEFEGVVGVCEDDDSFLATQAAISNRCAFHMLAANDAKNMCYAFGKMLSNSLNWRNQQYISMPFADDVDTLGDAETLFDAKVSFVISDDEFGERLALFACGGKAIVAPYIKKNLMIDLQSAALSYISGNQPAYTKKQAALLEDELDKVVKAYVEDESIAAGTVEILLEEDNFVASGNFNIAEPKALWRIFGEMRQTL